MWWSLFLGCDLLPSLWMRVQKQFRVSVELVRRVDAVRGGRGWNDWILEAVQEKLQREMPPEPLSETEFSEAMGSVAAAGSAVVRRAPRGCRVVGASKVLGDA